MNILSGLSAFLVKFKSQKENKKGRPSDSL